LTGVKARCEAPGASAKPGTLLPGIGGASMKPLLHLKTVILIAYVALCTQVVLSALEADGAAPPLAVGE
jgi:hypothetical protein